MSENTSEKFDLRTVVAELPNIAENKTPACRVGTDYLAFIDLCPMLGIQEIDGNIYPQHELLIPEPQWAADAFYNEPPEQYKKQGRVLFRIGTVKERLFARMQADNTYIFLCMLLGYVANPTHYHLMTIEKEHASLDGKDDLLVYSDKHVVGSRTYDFSSKVLKWMSEHAIVDQKKGYTILASGEKNALFQGVVAIDVSVDSFTAIGEERFLAIRDDIRTYALRCIEQSTNGQPIDRMILVQKYTTGHMYFVLLPTFKRGEVKVKNKRTIPTNHQREGNPNRVKQTLQYELIENMSHLYKNAGL